MTFKDQEDKSNKITDVELARKKLLVAVLLIQSMTKIQVEKLDVINYCRIYNKIVKKIPYKNSTKKLSSRFQ